jgi:hypothetical protein
MAIRKVPSSSFFPKGAISQPKSGRYLHVLEKQNGRNLNVFVCSSQPVLSLTCWGVPKRCPLCSQRDPIGSERPVSAGDK